MHSHFEFILYYINIFSLYSLDMKEYKTNINDNKNQ